MGKKQWYPVFNSSFYIFRLCNISLSPEVRFSAVFFSVLQLFESLVASKEGKISGKSAKNPVMQNISFVTLHSVANSQWKGKLKKKNLVFACWISILSFCSRRILYSHLWKLTDSINFSGTGSQSLRCFSSWFCIARSRKINSWASTTR